MFRKLKGLFVTSLFILFLCLATAIPADAAGVARIGRKSYPTLAAAIKAVKSNQTIVLKKNITIKDTVISKKKKTYTINLNRHQIKMKDFGQLLIEKGKVTFKNGTLKKTGTSDGILNVGKKAKVTIASGTYNGSIMNWGKFLIKRGQFKAKDNAIINEGKLTINNGSFSSSMTSASTISSSGTCTIKGGSFYNPKGGTVGIGPSSFVKNQKAILYIKGGSFKSLKEEAVSVSGKNTYAYISKGTLTGGLNVGFYSRVFMSGGNVTLNSIRDVNVNPDGIFTMTGGTINAPVRRLYGGIYARAMYVGGTAYLKGGTITGGYSEKNIIDGEVTGITHYVVIVGGSNVKVSGTKIINKGQGKNIYNSECYTDFFDD